MQKALILDDDEILLNALSSKFKDEGFEVVSSKSSEEIVALVKKNQPDIMISDIMMPGKNGIEVLTEIREIEEFKELPAIFMTNSMDLDYLADALDIKVNVFLQKSLYDPSKICDEAKKLLSK